MEEKKLNFNRPFLSVRRNYSPRTSDETKTTNNNSRNAAGVIPQLPSHKSELKSGPIRNPGAVPFIWEQTPGQPKQETKPKTRNSDRPPLAPKLPPGRNPKPNNPHHICYNNSNASPITNEDNRRDVVVEKLERSQERENEEEEDEKESCDSETYVDALDTLSRTESFFLNCSMSGLSGLDADLDVKPSGRFSTDPQARELMMDRFLPAAKAMTLETPQYNKEAQKQNAVREQQQQQNQIKKIVNHQHKPSLRYGPSFAKRYSHYQESEEQEEEESDDEYDQHANSMGVCGLIPRFCLKSSFGGLLNPVPAISVRTRVPISSRNKVQPKSSSSGSYSETEIQSRSNRTEIKSIDITRGALNEDKSTKSRNDGGQLETFIEEDKEVVAISEETMRKKGGGLTTFEELLADPKESNSGFPVTEKTLYVDTIRSVESPTTSSLTTQDTKHVSISRKEDHDTVTKRMDQMNAIDLYLEDFNKSNTSNIISSIDKQTQSRGFSSTVTKEIQVTEKEATESFEKELSRAIIVGNSYRNYSQLPIPPPLPKSPSDSWLWRTLPSISAKNSSLSSYIGAAAKPQNQVVSEDCPASNMKWETIVKTTTMQRRDLHYSRESLTSIPET
ncbi:hypothetical protein ACP275_08G216900 [Erythranthe tilingii]